VDDPEGGPGYWRVLERVLVLVLGAAAIALAFPDTVEDKVAVVVAIVVLGAVWYCGYVVGTRHGGPPKPPRLRTQ
jgi:hypothetical protein